MTEFTRAQAIAEIDSLNIGVPGERGDSPDGRDLLLRVVEEMGFYALRDDAVIRLAELHRIAAER
jgi:hypothetical protein